MKIRLFGFLCLALLAFSTFSVSSAFAQGTEKKQITHKLGSKTIAIAKPDAWVIAKAPKGSIGLFRAAGDKTSQIEIKYTPNVSAKQMARYCQTFHTSLQKMGLKPVKGAAGKSNKTDAMLKDVIKVGQKVGGFTNIKESEYTVKSSGRDYSVIVWEGHREAGVWLVIGFFPTDLKKVHYKKFNEVIKNITIK